jgi:hypothetical protein
MPMKSFNPKDLSIVVGAKAISGFADGTFVMIEMDEDAYSKVTGADGEVARAKSNNYSGKITLTLMQSSDSNDFLSALAIADRQTGTGVVPVTVRDAKGTTIVFAESAWVMRMPSTEFSKEIGNREWVLDCSQIEMYVGGHVAA